MRPRLNRFFYKTIELFIYTNCISNRSSFLSKFSLIMASLKVSEILSDIFWFCGQGWFTELRITDYFRSARDFHQRINCENICFCLMNIAIIISSSILTLSRRSCQSLVAILKNLPLKNSNEIQNPTITSLHAGSCILQLISYTQRAFKWIHKSTNDRRNSRSRAFWDIQCFWLWR